MKYSGIITAAGLSSRMGSFKPLMEINGIPMIVHTVMSMKSAGVSPICVVTGYRGAEIQNALSGFDVIFAENEAYASTDMLASVKLGLEKVKASYGFFLLPGDMPLVSPDIFKAVLNAKGDYIVPTANGKNAHPPLIKKSCFDSILNFDGDGGLPKALSGFEKTYIETGDSNSNKDADYMHEFEDIANIGKKCLGLSDELCMSLLKLAETPKHIIAHCLAVGKMAGHMAACLAEHGYFINIPLCRSAGNLHDIKRLERMHAEAGGEFLKSLGYDAVSEIVSHHMVSDGLPLDFNEQTVVFLADKLVREAELVTPRVRYAPAYEKFPQGTEIGNRVRCDCDYSEKLYNKYLLITGDKYAQGIS